ncbi:28598_t:CDS:2, partial [Racocetra persica]
MLLQQYTYLINNFNQLLSYWITKNFKILQIELDAYINVNNKEKVLQLRESKIKRPYSAWLRNIKCDVKSLSFQHVRKKFCNKFLKQFNDSHSPALALHSHENDLHLSAINNQELLKLLADKAKVVVNEYNSSGEGKAALQKYNTYVGSVFILCIVMGLIYRVHKKVSQ